MANDLARSRTLKPNCLQRRSQSVLKNLREAEKLEASRTSEEGGMRVCTGNRRTG